MKKWGKKEIMEHLDSFITEDFECDHISVTFPNDNMVRIELTNDSETLDRCKDCRFWQDNNGGYPNPDCPWGKEETPNPDDYCSFGEPKDGDGDG